MEDEEESLPPRAPRLCGRSSQGCSAALELSSSYLLCIYPAGVHLPIPELSSQQLCISEYASQSTIRNKLAEPAKASSVLGTQDCGLPRTLCVPEQRGDSLASAEVMIGGCACMYRRAGGLPSISNKADKCRKPRVQYSSDTTALLTVEGVARSVRK